MACQRFRRAETPRSRRQARAVPLVEYQGASFGRRPFAEQPPVALVVETVRIADPEAAVLRFTGVVEPKLRVGRFTAPVGLPVIAADSATLPVKAPLGVIVIAEVFPVAVPATTVIDVPLTVKLEANGRVTVTAGDVPAALL